MSDLYKCLFKRFYFAWIGLGRVGWSWLFLDCINIVEKLANNKVLKPKFWISLF